jgi:transcriptional regulator with XRE-family HTH domain
MRENFSLRLTRLLAERKLSAYMLGKVLGKSTRTIPDYISGRREPGKKILIEIADYFDVSIDWLCGCTEVRERLQVHSGD